MSSLQLVVWNVVCSLVVEDAVGTPLVCVQHSVECLHLLWPGGVACAAGSPLCGLPALSLVRKSEAIPTHSLPHGKCLIHLPCQGRKVN
eukprot:scaffold13582_cov182-Alexandrium_tamarense.AAC.4